MSTAPVVFQALLEPGGPSFMPTQIIIVSLDVVEALGGKALRRVVGTINNYPVRLGLLPMSTGERYLMVNKETCKAAGIQLGQQVQVSLAPDPTPNLIDMPDELAEGLAAWPEADASFQRLTAGMRRAIAYYVNSGKQSETRLRRTVQILGRLAVGAHPFRALPGEE